MFFLPAVQFADRKSLGCTDPLLTISHHLQKSLDTGMESYIVQHDFSAAFERVSHSGLLFKLKSIGVGDCVLSICREFLYNCRQKVVVDGAAVLLVRESQLFLACHREVCWVFFCLSFIPVTCLSWWRADYMPLLMTPHYLQYFASQQTDLLLLLPLIWTWLGLWSGAITCARY